MLLWPLHKFSRFSLESLTCKTAPEMSLFLLPSNHITMKTSQQINSYHMVKLFMHLNMLHTVESRNTISYLHITARKRIYALWVGLKGEGLPSLTVETARTKPRCVNLRQQACVFDYTHYTVRLTTLTSSRAPMILSLWCLLHLHSTDSGYINLTTQLTCREKQRSIFALRGNSKESRLSLSVILTDCFHQKHRWKPVMR